MTTLILAAHPDDEILGCGGSIAKFTDRGESVTVAILGEGATSRGDSREQTEAAVIEELHENARAANSLVGVSDVRFFNLPDNRFDEVPLLDVVKPIEGLIDELKPERVFCQHGGDLNQDHVILFRAAMIATRPLPGSPVRELIAYPVASSTEYAFNQFEPRFQPNLFLDISKSLDRKLKAMEAYTSERRASPHPRSPEALEAQAKTWGAQVGVEAAEAFQIIRKIES